MGGPPCSPWRFLRRAALRRHHDESGGAGEPAELAKITDYQAARWHRLHFKPASDTATNEQCLACHKEILTGKVREASPAGLKAANAEAWYQTLDTYAGPRKPSMPGI